MSSFTKPTSTPSSYRLGLINFESCRGPTGPLVAEDNVALWGGLRGTLGSDDASFLDRGGGGDTCHYGSRRQGDKHIIKVGKFSSRLHLSSVRIESVVFNELLGRVHKMMQKIQRRQQKNQYDHQIMKRNDERLHDYYYLFRVNLAVSRGRHRRPFCSLPPPSLVLASCRSFEQPLPLKTVPPPLFLLPPTSCNWTVDQ